MFVCILLAAWSHEHPPTGRYVVLNYPRDVPTVLKLDTATGQAWRLCFIELTGTEYSWWEPVSVDFDAVKVVAPKP